MHEHNGKSFERWRQAKPTVGGISFFITFILAALTYAIYFSAKGAQPEPGVEMASPFAINKEFFALLGVTTLGFLIGLSDDAYNTRPLLKLSGQIACGFILIAGGVTINVFPENLEVFNWFLTLFWVVGIMNSVNLLDNMDGVTATVSLTIVGTTLLVLFVLLSGGNPPQDLGFYGVILLAVAGAYIGFLFLNWNPSKLFMGDTGSMFIGAFFGFFGIKFFWNVAIPGGATGGELNGYDPGQSTVLHFILPIMAFIVPLMDTTFVTIARIMRGQSPFVGGKDHLTHHLTYLGVKEKWVPVILGLLSMLSGFLVIFTITYVKPWNHTFTAIFTSYVAVTFLIFWQLYRRGGKNFSKIKRYPKTVKANQQMRNRTSLIPPARNPEPIQEGPLRTES